jgi:hypothetical protein
MTFAATPCVVDSAAISASSGDRCARNSRSRPSWRCAMAPEPQAEAGSARRPRRSNDPEARRQRHARFAPRSRRDGSVDPGDPLPEWRAAQRLGWLETSDLWALANSPARSPTPASVAPAIAGTDRELARAEPSTNPRFWSVINTKCRGHRSNRPSSYEPSARSRSRNRKSGRPAWVVFEELD